MAVVRDVRISLHMASKNIEVSIFRGLPGSQCLLQPAVARPSEGEAQPEATPAHLFLTHQSSLRLQGGWVPPYNRADTVRYKFKLSCPS